MLTNNDEYLQVVEQVKIEIAQTRHRTLSRVNSDLICMYWRVGAAIDKRAEWGSGFVESLSKDIRLAYPGIKGFSTRYLKYMAKFYRESDWEIVQTVFAQLSWSHNINLMNKVINRDQRVWYAHSAIEHGWSLVVLVHQIESKLYERQVLAGKVNNFERTLPPPESELAQHMLKDPYVFDFITAKQGAIERDVEERMIENLTKLLLELGTGFAFVGRQYHLAVGKQDFYIDLLFYNMRLRSYVVVELKNTAFKPEFTGKLNFYLSAVDDLLCTEHDNHSIGLLLCKTKDNVVAEYALRDINKPMGVSEYRLAEVLPEGFAELLPSPEDIEKRM